MTIGCAYDDVLDARTILAGYVEPRLDTESHSFLEWEVVASDQVRLFVAL